MAATFSAFITTKYIKDNTPVLGYVNDDELRTFIRPAQDVYISRVLGTNLYDTLENNIINNTLTADQVDLLRTYIQPALQYWVIYEYILWSNYKFTNKAVSKQNSDNSNPSDLREVNYLKDSIRNWAEYYNQLTTNFLKDNPSRFPEYLAGGTGFQHKFPKGDNYFWGMFVPRQRGALCPAPTRWDNWPLNWGW
jgi:hypothetical protein